jgi:hypothetical protein
VARRRISEQQPLTDRSDETGAASPQPLPRAPPHGWRRARRRPRPRTFNDDFPTLGAKLRAFASLVCLALAMATLFSPGVLVVLQSFDVLRTDLDFITWELIVVGPALIMLVVGHALEPFSQKGRAKKAAKRAKAEASAESGSS